MKPILTKLFSGLLLTLALQAFGQTTMTTNFVVVSPATPSPYAIGTPLEVELRVTNFTNIESIQFPITFNKDALRFDSISEAAFSNWNVGNYVSPANSGKVGISWDGFSNGASMPFSFPNGTSIFKLHFTVIGNGTSNININPAGAPPSIDIVGGGITQISYQSGGTPSIILGTGNPPPPPLVGFKIVANNIYIPKGERGCMPITVNDFDGIVSMQWAVHWDNNVLNFECPRSFNLDGWAATDFNSSISPGLLLVGWADPSGTGKTRADGARIVDLCFKAVGAPGSMSNITIDGVGFPMGNGSAEAYNINSIDVWSTGGPNGASGVSAPLNVFSMPNTSSFDIEYAADKKQGAPNDTVCLPVKVKNFTSVDRAEFALVYNPSELQYIKTDFGTNPLSLVLNDVGILALPTPPTPLPSAHHVKFRWAGASAVSVANDQTIFSPCFKVLAPVGTFAKVEFTSTACPTITGMGTAKGIGNGVPFDTINGWIKSLPNGPTLVPTHITCPGGNNGSIALTNPPSTVATSYAWTGPGINAMNIGTEDPGSLTAGTYTVTVTYNNGSTATNSTTINQPAAFSHTTMVNTVSCFQGSNGSINLTVTGGTSGYTYKWDNMATTEDVNNLTIGFYSVTVTDSRMCTYPINNISVSGFSEIKFAANNPVITDVSCVGSTNGSIVVTLQGGAGNYTYKWSNNAVTKDLINVAAGTYSLTVTDMNMCTKVFTNLVIGSPTALTASMVSKTDAKCFNSPTGAVSIDVAGGTGNKTFCWSTTGGQPCASDVEDPNNLLPGIYSVTVTDQRGCTSTMTNIAINNPGGGALSVNGTTQPSPCFDNASGSINAAGSGGWGNYTYAWSGGAPSICCPSGLPGGLYTVTVTDAGQCTATQTFTITGSTQITSNPMVQHVTCFGANNGGINLQLNGGNPQYTVVWSNTPLTGQNIGTLPPGNYQPTVTDMQGCTKVFAPVTVNGPQELMVSSSIMEANPSDGAIDLEITQGGTPTFSYLWSNGASTQDINNLEPDDYSVTITDANGCQRFFTFTVPSGNVVLNPGVITVPACDGDGCINLSLPQTAANFYPITLNWGFDTMQVSSLTPSICDLNAGLYSITVTASNGNSSVLNAVQVDQRDPASINSNTTNPFSSVVKNGKITLNKANGVMCNNLQYQWGPAPLNSTSNEVNNLGQGTYFVTITNPCSGCESVEEFTLEYSPLGGVIDTLNPNCAGTADGYIHTNIQGGFLPYTFAWTGPNGFQSSAEDIDNLEPGVYKLTVTDQDNRVYARTFILESKSDLAITNVNETSQYGPFQVSGATMCDGAASVVFTPGIGNASILWSNGVNTASNTTLCGGGYSVTVTDAAGCSSVWTDMLTAPAAITMTPTSDGVKCYDDCDGSAKVVVGGGVGPYSVRWSTGQFDPLVTASGFSLAVNLCGGDYTVTITDDNEVQFISTVTVPEPPQIEVTFAATAPRNFNACDGDLLAEVSGATEPITYVWSGSFGHTGEKERAEELCSGEFVEFYITDANGCTAYATDSVPYPEDGCFRVSPILTPGQQDGKNDFVVITCIETATESHMEIYNRWGQLVFETDNYTNDDTNPEQNWNGLTSSGAALAEGVYYYILTYTFTDDLGNKREDTRKGAINLLR